MDEPFDLPVTYKGEELLFPFELLMLGYTHKFQVEVNGQTILFEPDEERNDRAVVNAEQDGKQRVRYGATQSHFRGHSRNSKTIRKKRLRKPDLPIPCLSVSCK